MKIIGKLKTYKSSEITKSRVSIGFECMDRGLINPDKCYVPLSESGIKYARVQTGWAICEKEKGKYDWTWLDGIVNSLLDGGVIPWFNLTYGNPLYMHDVDLSVNATCVGCAPTLYGEETLNAWLNFTKALVEHYKGRVTHYEIWNEPDCPQFWWPHMPNGKEYAELVTLTAKVIKATDPTIKTGGCTSSVESKDFLYDFATNIDPKDIDFLCYHTYSLRPEKFDDIIRSVMDMFKENGLGHVEFWQGESGCPSYFPPNHWLKNKREGNEHTQAAWIVRRLFLDLMVGSSLTSYFEIADLWEKPYQKAREVLNKPAAHGILNGLTYTKKHAYYVISRLATVLSGDVEKTDKKFCVTDAIDDGEKIINFVFKRNGKEILGYYKPYYVEDLIENRFDAEIDLANTGIVEPVIIDLLSGDVYECETENGVIKNAPIGYYPMLVCNRDTFVIE